MNPLRHIASATLLLACLQTAKAQEQSGLKPANDAAIWMSAGTEIKPFHKKSGQVSESRFFRDFRMTGEVGWRLNENGGNTKQVNIDAGARYRLAEFLKVGAQYRYTFRDRYHSNTQRIDLQLWLKWKKDRTSLDHRFEYEHDFIPVGKLRTVLRNRLTVEYNIPKWKPDPHISAEAFTGLHYTGNSLVGMRYELGTDLDLDKKKKRTLGLAVRFDQELDTAYPENSWILVIDFSGTFKRK